MPGHVEDGVLFILVGICKLRKIIIKYSLLLLCSCRYCAVPLNCPQTKGFSGAEFRKFKSPAEVKAYLADAGSDAVEVFGRESSTTEGAHAVPPGSLALWFDGGSRRNPGPSGAGAVIFSEENVELYRCGAI